MPSWLARHWDFLPEKGPATLLDLVLKLAPREQVLDRRESLSLLLDLDLLAEDVHRRDPSLVARRVLVVVVGRDKVAGQDGMRLRHHRHHLLAMIFSHF